jgi:hypothetical protein
MPFNQKLHVISCALLLMLCVFCESVSAKEIVAKLFGKAIYREDIGANKNLESLIIPALYKRFSEQNHIVVTESEIKSFNKKFDGFNPNKELANDSTTLQERKIMHDMAQSMVLNWKINKALYKKYGGDVIFQQANPLEPIGAERQFLQEQEKAGAFQILNAQEHTKFFNYYLQSHRSFIIPPSEVNYDIPWWEEK